VRGTELRVKRIKEVLSMPIDLTDLKQGFERKLALDLEGLGVTVEGELPSLNLEIRATSANFRIRNVKIKVIGNSRASITDRFKTATVLVRVSPQDLKKLDVDQVEASVDVSSMSAGVYKPKVHVKLPKAIGIVRIVPDVVEVKVP
jgi:YbbR domain-containing protein